MRSHKIRGSGDENGFFRQSFYMSVRLSPRKMIGVFTRKIIFLVGNLRSASGRIKQVE